MVAAGRLLQLFHVDESGAAIGFLAIHQQKHRRPGENQETPCYQRLFTDIRIKREHGREPVCQTPHPFKHHVAYPAVGSLDEKEAQAVVRQRLLNVFYVRQVFHSL